MVRVSGLSLLLVLAPGVGGAAAEGVHPLRDCEAKVRGEPRSLGGYICLLAHQGADRAEVLRFLDGRMRSDPQNPRPRLYAGVIRSLAGEAVAEREWRTAIAGFAREKDVTGEVYAITSLISARCVSGLVCDAETRALLWRVGELAHTSGKVDLQQVAEIWAMKVGFAVDDMDATTAAEARLLALGEPRSPWLRSESLQARAHLAALLLDDERQRKRYRELLDVLDADDPRRPAAVGGEAAAAMQLALRNLENRGTAERMLREAIVVQERAGIPWLSPWTGSLASRVHLAVLLGPTEESLALLRTVLRSPLANGAWQVAMYPRLALAEHLATADPPRPEEAMEVAREALEHAFRTGGDYERARTLVLRSRMAFRLGQFSLGRADGLAALDHAERLREQQRSMPLRLRYAQTLSFAYLSLAGALTRYRAPGETPALDDAFQVMERLRARGLMETLLAEGQPGEPIQMQPPTLAQVQGELEPREALLSFQLWRPEPTVDAPYREGSSWVTVVTRERAEAFAVPGADELGRQIRAWTGLLERRDGSDRRAGARLYGELLGPALAALPPQVDRLVIVADGPLHRLPFDALSEGPEEPYLVERFGVSIEPSAALWLKIRAAPRQPPGRLLVLADPASVRPVGPVLGGSSRVFGALAYARREAQAALAAFPGGSELRTGPPASEAFLKGAELAGVSMLHFATHAVTDERDPEHTAIVLAPGSSFEDGRLEPAGDCPSSPRRQDGGSRRLRDLGRAGVPRRRGDEPGPRLLQRRGQRRRRDAGPGAGRRGQRVLLGPLRSTRPRCVPRGSGGRCQARRHPPGGTAGRLGLGGAAGGCPGTAPGRGLLDPDSAGGGRRRACLCRARRRAALETEPWAGEGKSASRAS